MDRLWIDITLMLKWRGSFTGIQRLAYNYIRRFNDDPLVNAHFFAFTGKEFIEVPFGALEAALNGTEEVPSEKSLSFSERVKKAPRDLRAYGMPVVKRTVRKVPYLGSVAASGYKAVRAQYRHYRIKKGDQRSARESIFSGDDTVLIIDGNWDNQNNFIKAINNEKRRVGFNLSHMVHDIIAIKNPAYAAKEAYVVIGKYFTVTLPTLDQVICISQSTLKDVVEFATTSKLSLTNNRQVIRIGDTLDAPGSGMAHPPKGVDLSGDFLLCVGTIEVRKNHHALFSLYKLAQAKGIELPNLVIVGRKGWMSEETMELLKNDPDVNSKIHIFHNTSDQELSWLYQNCLFTVFPSFYEGWGLPVAESLRYGKVCVSSSTSSLPEVGGDLAEYFCPHSTDEFLAVVLRCLETKYRQSKEDAIKRRYIPYSWDDSYAELKKILHNM